MRTQVKNVESTLMEGWAKEAEVVLNSCVKHTQMQDMLGQKHDVVAAKKTENTVKENIKHVACVERKTDDLDAKMKQMEADMLEKMKMLEEIASRPIP